MTLVLALALGCSLYLLSLSLDLSGQGSTIHDTIFRRRWPRKNPTYVLPVLFAKEGGRWIHVDEEPGNAYALTVRIRANPADIFVCVLSVLESDDGFYALTTHRLKVSSLVGGYTLTPVPDDTKEAVLGATIDYLSQRADKQALAANLREGGAVQTSTIWFGYLHDVTASATLVAFLLSWGWVPEYARRLLRRHRGLRVAQGLCVTCGYDLRGLSSDRCPECGNSRLEGA